jgi:hypothetical protein
MEGVGEGRDWKSCEAVCLNIQEKSASIFYLNLRLNKDG